MKADRLFLLAAALLAPACREQPAPAAPEGPQTLAVPEHGLYTGAYIEFGDHEDDVTVEGIEAFEKLVGKHQAIVASSSYWGEQTFPAENVRLIQRHGSMPLVFWSPWDRPYVEEKGPDRFSLTSVLAGKWDTYIDQWADGARAFGHPMFVSLGNEMNGSWFPWSGLFYGGGRVVPGSAPVRYEGPELFKKAWHHIVDRVRARGATNILWVFHVMNYSWPQDTWNLAVQYYPGPDYVDWLGMSLYGEQFRGDDWSPFLPLLDWPYRELCQLAPHKPVMLTEWGVGEFPKKGDRAQWIADGFAAMQSGRYPRLKAAIFWHERWQNDDGSYSNLHVNSTPESLAAYGAGVAAPYFLAAPQFVPASARGSRASEKPPPPPTHH